MFKLVTLAFIYSCRKCLQRAVDATQRIVQWDRSDGFERTRCWSVEDSRQEGAERNRRHSRVPSGSYPPHSANSHDFIRKVTILIVSKRQRIARCDRNTGIRRLTFYLKTFYEQFPRLSFCTVLSTPNPCLSSSNSRPAV